MVREPGPVGLVDRLDEDVGIQKVEVSLPRLLPILSFGPGVYGDLLPDLAHARKAGRQMLRPVPEGLLGGRGVEARVDAHRPEEGEPGVLLQHPGRFAITAVVPMVDESPPTG